MSVELECLFSCPQPRCGCVPDFVRVISNNQIKYAYLVNMTMRYQNFERRVLNELRGRSISYLYLLEEYWDEFKTEFFEVNLIKSIWQLCLENDIDCHDVTDLDVNYLKSVIIV